MHPTLKALLALHQEDTTIFQLETQLKRIPEEVKKIQLQINRHAASVEEARIHLRQVELEHTTLEAALKEKESKVIHYKTQQVSIKTQEAYVTLQNTLETFQQQCNELENQALGVLLTIDPQKQQLRELEQALLRERQAAQQSIQALEAKQTEAQQKRALHVEAASLLASKVPETHLKVYTQVKKHLITPPFIVELRNQICSGCHLKLDNAVRDQSLKSNPGDKEQLVRCSQCGRILVEPPLAH